MGNNVVFFVAGVLIVFGVSLAMVAPYLLADPNQALIDSCTSMCNDYIESGRSLDVGPCLMDPIPDTDWVCDVVHVPRNDMDNSKINQCLAFTEGSATHFIELDTQCKFLRAF